MVLQSTHDLEEMVGNKYSLVIIAAQRARMLKASGRDERVQARVPFDVENDHPLTAALSEVAEGFIRSIEPTEEEIIAAPREEIDDLLAASGFGDEDDEFGDIDDDEALVDAYADPDEDDDDDDAVEAPVAAVAVVATDDDDAEETDEDSGDDAEEDADDASDDSDDEDAAIDEV